MTGASAEWPKHPRIFATTSAWMVSQCPLGFFGLGVFGQERQLVGLVGGHPASLQSRDGILNRGGLELGSGDSPGGMREDLVAVENTVPDQAAECSPGDTEELGGLAAG